jgi:hypothetical protein
MTVKGDPVPQELWILLGGVLATYGVLRTAQQGGESAGGSGEIDAATFARAIADEASNGTRSAMFEQTFAREQRLMAMLNDLQRQVDALTPTPEDAPEDAARVDGADVGWPTVPSAGGIPVG